METKLIITTDGYEDLGYATSYQPIIIHTIVSKFLVNNFIFNNNLKHYSNNDYRTFLEHYLKGWPIHLKYDEMDYVANIKKWEENTDGSYKIELSRIIDGIPYD
jgi:hypothetical protein